MAFDLTIPLPGLAGMTLSLDPGDQMFILGANGTGKSSLMQRIYAAFPGQVRHVTAHRQNWFPSSELTLTSQQKRQMETDISHADRQPQSRWRDDYSAHRTGIALYDLVDAENVRARAIAHAVDVSDVTLAKTLSEKSAPLAQINDLLATANIPIKIVIRAGEEVRALRSGGIEYGVSELSDGERNALLVAANVLTARPGTLILIDEPERHLHRSIISPLLTHLFAARSDCAFVISTHEVMLPVDSPGAYTLLVRSCTYSGQSPIAWEADLLRPGAEIDEAVRRDILGARRRILFVEGAATSLDTPLYALLFPDVSVVARQSCRDVEQAVMGIRAGHALHWLHAYGIVDNDRRGHDDVASLEANGVYALPVYSVESVYYHPLIQRHLAARHASITGEDAASMLASADAAVVGAARHHADRLAERVAEKAVREVVFQHLPQREDIAARKPVEVSVDVAKVVDAERGRIQCAIDSANVEALIARYPMRETPALTGIARAIGFQGRTQYESAVLKMLRDDAVALAEVRTLFGRLTAAIGEAQEEHGALGPS